MFVGSTGAYPTVAPGVADLLPIVQGGIVKTATVGALAGTGAVAAAASAFSGRMPSLMASPPAVTVGVANASTAISGSVLVTPWEKSSFNYLGGPYARGTTYSNQTIYYLLGVYPQITTPSPVAVEFDLDSVDGKFEVYTVDGNFRLLLGQQDGSWAKASAGNTVSRAATGNAFLDLVNLGAGGQYRARLEFPGSSKFAGIRTAPTDGVRATPPKRLVIFAGDSFTEPTIADIASSSVCYHDGFVQALNYLTGWDCWSAGSGGTGYVTTNGARPKLGDRLANDILAFAPKEVILACGINDGGTALTTLTTEVANCITACKAAGAMVTVCSPFWRGGAQTISTDCWQAYDIIKAAAASAGCNFVDVLNIGSPSFLSANASYSSTISAAVSYGATTLQVADVPAYFKVANNGLDGWWLHIGAAGATNQSAIPITNITGTGPYTLTTTVALGAFASGTTVRLGGPAFLSGTGTVFAPAGNGTSDRYVGSTDGSDTTHPTALGHRNLGFYVARLRAAFGILA